MEDRMAKALFSFAFSLLFLTFLYGHSVSTKGQQKSEAITTIDGKSVIVRDKENSKRFADYNTGKKLTDPAFLEQQPNEIVVETAPPIICISFERPCPEYPPSGLVGLAYAADAIVIGSVKEKITSQFTEDEDFLFSEYAVVIEEAIKDNPNASIGLNSVISVIRSGGKVKFNGKIISAVVNTFNPFFEGDRYLLYLKYIPETQSYQAFSNASFLIDGDVVRTHKMGKPERNKQTFITEVKDAVFGERCQSVVLN
jgi:hypothetical protein